MSSGRGAGDVSGLVSRTGKVRRCEECIITRNTGVFGGIFANFESGFAGFGWIFGMVGGGLGADGVGCLLLSESGFAGFGWIFGMVGGGLGADGLVCFIAV